MENKHNLLLKTTNKDLISKCKELGINKYSSKNKEQLIQLIENHLNNLNNIKSLQSNNVIESVESVEDNVKDDLEDDLEEVVELNNIVEDGDNGDNVDNDNDNDNDNVDNGNDNDNKKLLFELKKKYNLKDIATKLNLAVGTIQRWIELDNIPHQYTFDLLRLLTKDIDYSIYKSNQKDQFFTSVESAKKCWDTFCKITKINISDYIFIEPSAGDGSFTKCIPANSISLDIEPRYNNIIKQDYLLWTPPSSQEYNNKKYIVIGNPPFGLRGHTALNFINHSYDFADYVAFILPQLFESDGKGCPRKRVKGYNLIYSEKLSGIFHTPEKLDVNINCVFQIWSKYKSNNNFIINSNENDKIKIYSLSDGGTIATTRNKNMLDKCDIYIPSTCFGKDTMKLYSSFNDLPNRKGYGVVFIKDKENMIKKSKTINWGNIAFLSSNSAYNLRTSLILDAFK